jgi:hypothetical protein
MARYPSPLLLLLLACSVAALDNGRALLPPMGFANWNGFQCNYNDSTFRVQADALDSLGLAKAGFRTMIIQECITAAGHRDARGVLQPDPARFPHGVKGLCDYIHSKGLECGIYTDVGPRTCAGYEGSYGHEDLDAQTFASWGVDFVEEDSCNHQDIKPYTPYSTLYGRMRDALNKTGRPMTFYMCVQGQEDVFKWGRRTGNLWRTTMDICAPNHATWGKMLQNFYGNAHYPNVTAPGALQDPDMLIVGMPIDGQLNNHTRVQWRSHLSLWAMSAAPLWIGVDMTRLPPGALEVLTNSGVLAVDQDPLGHAAVCVSKDGCPPMRGDGLGSLRFSDESKSSGRPGELEPWVHNSATDRFALADGSTLTAGYPRRWSGVKQPQCTPDPVLNNGVAIEPAGQPLTNLTVCPGRQVFVINAAGQLQIGSGGGGGGSDICIVARSSGGTCIPQVGYCNDSTTSAWQFNDGVLTAAVANGTCSNK